jgi:hypothetical protein
MFIRPLLLFTVASVLLPAAGCGPARDAGAAPSAALAQADTAGPRATLVRWHHALAAGDKAAYVACFVGTEEELVMVLAAFEAVQAAYEFQRAVTTAYGADAWKVFEASDASRIDVFPRDERWPARITVARTGSTALAYTPRGRVPLVLSQADGVWRIHASGLVPPGLEANRAADYLFRFAAALRNLIPQVTGRSVTAEKANKDAVDDFRARIAPAERPAASATVNAFLTP